MLRFLGHQCYQFQVILYDTLLHNYSLHVRTSQLEPVAVWWTAAYIGPGPYIPAKGRVPQANYHYGAYICNHLGGLGANSFKSRSRRHIFASVYLMPISWSLADFA